MPDTAAGPDSYIVRRRQAVGRCRVALDAIGLEDMDEWMTYRSVAELEALSTRLEAVLASVDMETDDGR
jgi:hypothetical protein